jgi:hypothetical protein
MPIPPSSMSVARSWRTLEDLEETLFQFHANSAIQHECREVLANAERYLSAEYLPGKGNHYVAAYDIPAGMRLAFYYGFIERADASHSRDHEMHMGEVGLGFQVTLSTVHLFESQRRILGPAGSK